MQALFADVPSALANTLEIARRCNVVLQLGQPQLPEFPTPEVNGQRLSTEAYFRQAAYAGLEERLQHLYRDAGQRELRRPEYVERLEFEINTILKMGFPGYFLIVGISSTGPRPMAARSGRGVARVLARWWPMRSK